MSTTRTNTAKWIVSSNRWQINVQKDGVRKTFVSSTPGRAGQKEANHKADVWLASNIATTAVRIDALYTQFIASKKESTSRSNYANIESRYKNHIKEYIGFKRISTLTEQDLQNIINKAYAQHGLSAKSLKNLRGDLSSFLKFCRMKHVTELTAEFLTIPAAAKRPCKCILQPQALTILMSTETTVYRGQRLRDPYVNAYRLAVLTGMRPGELHGLRWSDLSGRKLTLHHAINAYDEITQGKNKNAVRPIILSDLALKYIQEQKAYSEKNELIFPISNLQSYRNYWRRYCKSNNISYVTPYELRHTFVSVAQVLPEGQVKQIVGHSHNMDTFGVYGHTFSNQIEQASQKLNEVFTEIIQKKA